jgi:probable selenium-dependent hydroxylase accessory protein YqeC
VTAALPTALGLDEASVLSVVGAGGKKTTLYRLAGGLEGAVVTSTVWIPPFADHVERVVETADPVATLDTVPERPLGLVLRQARPDRYAGYEPSVVDDVAAAGGTPLLVKADGARNRLFKAPAEDEPRIPESTTVVVALASVRAVGEPLSEDLVHRPERVAALTGRDVGDEIRPADVATVLAHDAGGLKNVPDDARVVPVVNMVDTPGLVETGRSVARGVLERASRVDGVLLTRLNDPDPVVDVVER